ncbi:MAG: AlkA N-terminal domain-containing protein [Pseudomonadota bacterium]|nr:AlkA N-terminal domain-containing protein [Pseudomonadota bacterium]
MPSLDPDACYRALQTHDARFDGAFFTGVTSTGIYCRPVCRVKTPRRENCRFFPHAAQAEAAGFRPCLRCRPELAPGALTWSATDAAPLLVQHALRLLQASASDASDASAPRIAALAARLGVSERHLRRVFEAELGVSPLAWLQTQRLLLAKQLLADTALPVAQVALAAGFASVRAFNAAFAAHYGLKPTQLRRAGHTDAAPAHTPADNALCLHLSWRPPYDVDALLAFFAARQIDGVESVNPATRTLSRSLQLPSSDATHPPLTGWLACTFDEARHRVRLRVAPALAAALPQVLARVRAWLDLDADPAAIHAVLGADFPHGAGLRVPGTLCGFELAVRAVLGQQVTVAAARTLTTRLAAALGKRADTPIDGVHLHFPTPAALAAASGEQLGQLGITRQRQAAVQALARAVAAGQLALHPGADVPATVAALQALPGIGEWTAQYIALRALRWPDALPAGDVALHRALGLHPPHAAKQAEAACAHWRPWRGYGLIRAWHALPPAPQPSA